MSQQVSPGLPIRLRRVRDSGALLFMLAFLGFLGYIIWDGLYMKETDINLIVHGHDSFGNICGRNNKPIKFSEKSGQNYTSKPYTKYTLINSQFERYTLDSSRLKYGELIYVKEPRGPDNERGDGGNNRDGAAYLGPAALVSRPAHSQPSQIPRFKQQQQQQQQHHATPSQGANSANELGKREALLRERIAATTQTNRIQFNGNFVGSSGAGGSTAGVGSNARDVAEGALRPRIEGGGVLDSLAEKSLALNDRRHRRSPSSSLEGAPLNFDPVELARTNRSLLNALRTNMMYQYPPMYGYSTHSSPLSGGEPRRVENRTNYAVINQRQPLQSGSLTAALESANRGHASVVQKSTALNGGQAAVSGRANHLADQLDEIPAGAAATIGSAIRYASSVQDSRSLVPLAGGADDRSTSPISLLRVNNRPNGGGGGGGTGNESDRYEHTFVTPISVMTVAAEGHRNGYYPSSHYPPVINGISQSEVANQLLYLTECVSSCPSDHVELIFYRCMPNNWRFSLFPNAINVTRTFIDDILTDVSHCYRELIYTFSLAFVLSLGLLILLRFLASIIIWSCLVLLILIFLSMASYSWLTFYNHIMDLEHVMPHDSVYAEKLASSDKWLIGSIFLTFIAFATIGTILFMRKRILLVTTLFRESGKAIADMPLLLLQPLLTFAALVAIMAAWIMGLICLQSMKVPVVDMNTGFVVFKAETLYKIMKWYHIFAFLWVSHFAIACQHYVIGASVSKWYFSPNRYELSSPIGTSISELILYYLGSVALGSFLVAIFKVIRVITRQIQFLVQRSCMSPPLNANQAMGGGSGNGGQGASSSSCGSLGYVWRLFIWFFDNIVMIINRDAYVEIAIHGHSFLGGARRAFTVLASNPLRLLAIKSVGNLLLVIAKICVVVGTVSMAYVLLDGKSHQLNYSWSPIVISAIYAYIVAHWFLSVYEMVIDALFICYCEDYEQKNIELNREINGSNFRAQILNNGQIY